MGGEPPSDANSEGGDATNLARAIGGKIEIKIHIFDGTNWESWKRKIENFFCLRGVDGMLEGVFPRGDGTMGTEGWEKWLYNFLTVHMNKEQVLKLEGKLTEAERKGTVAWKWMNEEFEPKRRAQKFTAISAFFKKMTYSDAKECIAARREINRKIVEVGAPLPGSLYQVCALLYSLPPHCAPLIDNIALEMAKAEEEEDELTVEDVERRITDFIAHRQLVQDKVKGEKAY